MTHVELCGLQASSDLPAASTSQDQAASTAAWLSRLISEVAPHDLTSRQLVVLAVLTQCEGSLSVGEVASRAQIPKPAASRAIQGLNERGLADNVLSKVDRRSREIAATRAGRDLVKALRVGAIAPESR